MKPERVQGNEPIVLETHTTVSYRFDGLSEAARFVGFVGRADIPGLEATLQGPRVDLSIAEATSGDVFEELLERYRQSASA